MGSWTTGIIRMTRKLSCFHTGRVPMSLICRGRISVMCRRHRTLRYEWLPGRSLFRGLTRSGIGGGGRPPMVPDQTGGGLGHRSRWGCGRPEVEHRGTPTSLLPLDRQIMQEAEVITTPRRETHGHGGAVSLLSLSYPQEGHK